MESIKNAKFSCRKEYVSNLSQETLATSVLKHLYLLIPWAQESLEPSDQNIQEFREWAKSLYRNFAMNRNSSPEDFLALVKRHDYKLIQVFKMMLRMDDSTETREEISQVIIYFNFALFNSLFP